MFYLPLLCVFYLQPSIKSNKNKGRNKKYGKLEREIGRTKGKTLFHYKLNVNKQIN